MTRVQIYASAVAALAAGVFALGQIMGSSPSPTTRTSAGASQSNAAARAHVAAAPGKVEPQSEEIHLSADISGRISVIHVKEGDKVLAGEVVAELENALHLARVAEAKAHVDQKEAELQRVINGAHPDERREAAASVKAAEAELQHADADLGRRQSIVREGHVGVVAQDEFQRVRRIADVARARLEAARARQAFINSPARDEDVARASAEVALARARLAEEHARLDKTYIRSPVAGTILRKFRNAGEVVSETQDSRIIAVGDMSILNVRAEVDETDIGKIKLGDRAYAKADAFGDQRFWGRVTRIGQALGKKNIRTDVPGERVDTKVLEVIVKLEAPGPLLPGLRVDVFFQGADKPGQESRLSSSR